MTAPSLPNPALPHLTDEERIRHVTAFAQQMTTRRSCRTFATTPVPCAVIEQAILAAGPAPSGATQQPWHFAVVECAAAKAELRATAEEEERAFYAGRAGDEWLAALAPLGTDAAKPFLTDAPALIVAFAQRKGEDGAKHCYVTEGVGLACDLLNASRT